MTTTQMLDKLQNYFNADPYSAELSSQLFDFIDTILEKDRAQVYTRIIRDRKYRSPILVNDIRIACESVGVPYTRRNELEPIQLTCEACETDYNFCRVTDDQNQLNGIHARCPRCGLPGSDQITAHLYSASSRYRGLPDWFNRELEHFRNHEWPDGNYFNRAKFEKEHRELLSGIGTRAPIFDKGEV